MFGGRSFGVVEHGDHIEDDRQDACRFGRLLGGACQFDAGAAQMAWFNRAACRNRTDDRPLTRRELYRLS